MIFFKYLKKGYKDNSFYTNGMEYRAKNSNPTRYVMLYPKG